ncbi:uncharacterized protein LOC144616727 isoform X2 [Panthera onca]
MPDPGFMTDVKYIEVCCEADRLIGKEMKDHQEDGWEAFLKGFPVSSRRWVDPAPGVGLGGSWISLHTVLGTTCILGFPLHHLGFSPRLPTNKRFCQRGSGSRLVSFISSSEPAAKVVKGFLYGTEKANLPRREKQDLVSRKRQEQGPPHPQKGFDATLWKLTSSEPRRARLFPSGLCPAVSTACPFKSI